MGQARRNMLNGKVVVAIIKNDVPPATPADGFIAPDDMWQFGMSDYQKKMLKHDPSFFHMIVNMLAEGGKWVYPDAGLTFEVRGGKFRVIT